MTQTIYEQMLVDAGIPTTEAGMKAEWNKLNDESDVNISNDSAWSDTMLFYLSEDLGDSGLATLLAAYSMGKTIWVRTLGATPGSIISIIYVND